MHAWRGDPIPRAIQKLVDVQLASCQHSKELLTADLLSAEALPEGRYVSVKDPTADGGSISKMKKDYIAELSALIVRIDTHIADLGG